MVEKDPLFPDMLAGQVSPAVADAVESSSRYHIPEYALADLCSTAETIVSSDISQEQKDAAAEILLYGTLEGKEVGMPEVVRDGQSAVQERIWTAKLMASHPEVAQTVVEKEIAGFHATGSFALAGLIEEGALLSGRKLRESGKASVTGAHDAHEDGQPSISFGALHATKHNVEAYGGQHRKRSHAEVSADLHGQIEGAKKMSADYAGNTKMHKILAGIVHNAELALSDYEHDPDSLAATMMRWQFPVAIGVNRSFVRAKEAERQHGSLRHGQSGDFAEFRPAADIIPIEALPVIAVPTDKMRPVSELLGKFGHAQVSVVSLESIAA